MKTIDELQAELRLICSELEKLKESQKAETREVNFREIAARAERYPILGHPMWNEDEHTKDMYILMLLSVAALDDDKYEESFMTIYRIAFGMNFSGNMEDLFLSAKSMKFETLDECTRLFLNGNLSLVLLLECMMIAAGFENGKRRAMEYLSQLAVMLNVGKDEIEFLANLARVVLTQDLNEYKTNKLNVYGDIFDFYIDTFANNFVIKLIEPDYAVIDKKHNYGFLAREYALRVTKISKVEPDKITFLYTSNFDGYRVNEVDYYTNGLNIDYTTKKSLGTIPAPIGIWEVNGPENAVFGVMSNHPLAHSKAIAQYIAAGGVIDKQDK